MVQKNYLCPYCGQAFRTAQGVVVHGSMKHPNLPKLQIKEVQPQPENIAGPLYTGKDGGNHSTKGNEDAYPDFLFDTPEEKQVFLYLKSLQNNEDTSLCGKTALYLFNNSKYVSTIKKIADVQTPLYISSVGDVLQDIVPSLDLKTSLTHDIQTYTENLTKLREDYNILAQELSIKQKQVGELQGLDDDIAARKQELSQLEDKFNNKKIDKIIVSLDEILTSKFIHNQIENYYLITADNYKSLTYLFDRLVVLYGKIR